MRQRVARRRNFTVLNDPVASPGTRRYDTPPCPVRRAGGTPTRDMEMPGDPPVDEDEKDVQGADEVYEPGEELFGEDGFEKMAKRVADLEQSIGIDDLAQFTPR